MRYKDAGKLIDASMPGPSEKIYPRFTVDLDQFPDITADVDEEIELHIRGRVCGVTHTDYCHSLDLEVRSIAPSEDGGDKTTRVAVINIADQELTKLKRRSL